MKYGEKNWSFLQELYLLGAQQMILMEWLTALGTAIEPNSIILVWKVSTIYDSKFCKAYIDFAFDTKRRKLFLNWTLRSFQNCISLSLSLSISLFYWLIFRSSESMPLPALSMYGIGAHCDILFENISIWSTFSSLLSHCVSALDNQIFALFNFVTDHNSFPLKMIQNDTKRTKIQFRYQIFVITKLCLTRSSWFWTLTHWIWNV